MKHINTLSLSSLSIISMGIMLAGCSHDDHQSTIEPKGPAIKFAVVTPPAPRVSTPETTTNTIDNFLLNAFTNQNVFIENLEVTGSNDNGWTYAPEYYWPASPVNFYAVSPTESGLTRPDDESAGNFKVRYQNKGKTDLLYSVAANQAPSSTTTPKAVSLNFRHALSRVAVRMKSSNSQIRVKVYDVDLENIYEEGILEFPRETTSISGSVMGSWTARGQLSDADIYDNASGSDYLTATPVEFVSTGYFYAMPQLLQQAQVVGNDVKGAHIKVKCVIDDAKGNRLWPNSQTPAVNVEDNLGIVRFPLYVSDAANNWEGGKGYIYNLDIKQLPGLDLIDFTVTVDDYDMNGDGTDLTPSK